MKKEKYMSWDTYFMSVALLSSFRSKDKITQNWACIADENKKVVWIGYNWLPAWCDDDDPQFWTDNDNDPEYSRHSYVVHAEKNAIYNSIWNNLKWGTIYVTQFPCPICSQAIIQTWIKKVVFLNIKKHQEAFHKTAYKMFSSAWVDIVEFNKIDIQDKEFIKKLDVLNKIFY